MAAFDLGLLDEMPQIAGRERRPQPHLRVMVALQGVDSGQAAGAWQGVVQGWCAGRLYHCQLLDYC